MTELLMQLLSAIVAGAACGLVALGGMRAELRHLGREVTRAHKRLDAIGAPNVTLEK